MTEKIDTQGMSLPSNNKNWKIQPHKPLLIEPHRLHTPEMVKELKILMNEVLDEREYKKQLAGAYDNVKPLPPSYFDTKNFKHGVDEDEPPYEAWQ
tara:strand:- start:232 stop:519 length:288 start_codon:yes stop_codon:yes gene_type:complete